MYQWCVFRYYNESGVTELLIIRDPHYGRMCFKSVKTSGVPSASAFFTSKNILSSSCCISYVFAGDVSWPCTTVLSPI